MRSTMFILSAVLICALAVGCEKPPMAKPAGGQSGAHGHDDHGHDDHGHDDHGHDDHGHDDHGHDDHDDHAEEMGPNKGHIIRLTPTDYVAEWRHYKGNNVIRIYVLDADKKTTAVNATVMVKSASGKSKQTFELQPEDADDEGKTGVYMLDELGLATAMNLGVTVSVTVDGKVFEGDVPPHAPHHH